MATGEPTFEEQLETLRTAKNFAALASLCHERELQFATGDQKDPNAEQLVSLQLVAFLLDSQIDNARFLYKRLPKSLKQSTQIVALWKVGQTLWARDRVAFFKAVNSTTWSNELAPYITLLAETTRQNVQDLIARAYSSIGLPQASAMLGFSQEQTAQHVVKLGWTYDKSSGMIRPLRPQPPADAQVNFRQLQQLTNYAVQLE